MLVTFADAMFSHQYEYDNEHVIKSFFFVFVFAMHIKRISTESRRKSRLDSKGYQKKSNNQIVLQFQGEHVHKSKKMNKIMFVLNVRKWKPILVDASETTEYDVTTLTHVPIK
jgi:hypothetical protein